MSLPRAIADWTRNGHACALHKVIAHAVSPCPHQDPHASPSVPHARAPGQVEVASKYCTVQTLRQQYIFVPAKFKDCYLVYILNELSGSTTMVGSGEALAERPNVGRSLGRLGLAHLCLN